MGLLGVEEGIAALKKEQEELKARGLFTVGVTGYYGEETRKAVELIGGRYETESSGGITFDTIRDYAEQGVDFISVGALTHSVKGLDMSFKAADSDKLVIK